MFVCVCLCVSQYKMWEVVITSKPGCVCVTDVLCHVLDVQEMEKLVRSVEADGLRWGACEFAHIAQTLDSCLRFLPSIVSQAGSSGIWYQEVADQVYYRR